MNKTSKLIIVGDSAFAEVAFEYFTHDSPYEVVAFSVEAAYLKRDKLFNLPIVAFESLEQRFSPQDCHVYVAIPYAQLNRLRTRLADSAKQKGYRLASYVSSGAHVWPNAQIGEHCFIFEQNVIQPFVRIGNNVVLWSGNHIGHHSVIGDNCFFSSHVVISGYVEIGANCFLGVNATIINNIKVGKDCWIAPSSTIIKDSPDGTMYRPPRTDVAPIDSLTFCGIRN